MTPGNKQVDKIKSPMIAGENKEKLESEIIYDTDIQIKEIQNRIWKALKRRYQYDSNLESGQNF